MVDDELKWRMGSPDMKLKGFTVRCRFSLTFVDIFFEQTSHENTYAYSLLSPYNDDDAN